jgi:hypothetical protein
LHENWNKSMGMGEKSIYHVRKVVIVDSKKQMCTWVRMAKKLQWEYDGEIPITMSINTSKYFQTHWNALKYIEIYYKYIEIHHKYIINTFKCIQIHYKFI